MKADLYPIQAPYFVSMILNLTALIASRHREQDCQQLRITVTVESERPIQQLWSQLNKLVDVSRVDALEQPSRISA